jgi:hypothetical protein
MSNKQKTAVEWLMNNIYIDPNPELYAKFEQAKEMEKEQIKNAYDDGIWGVGCRSSDADKYYNETYGGGE